MLELPHDDDDAVEEERNGGAGLQRVRTVLQATRGECDMLSLSLSTLSLALGSLLGQSLLSLVCKGGYGWSEDK